MEQFYYTSCADGRSVSGQSGFNVRAISSRLSESAARGLASWASYLLPAGANPENVTAENAPRKLAHVETTTGRALVHSVWVGSESEGRYRMGNYFAHVLTELPDTLDGLHAIMLWQSPFWQKRDDDFSSQLPSVELKQLQSAACHSTDDQVRTFLRRPDVSRLVALALSAYLETADRKPIYVVGPSDDVAMLIYVVALCLPQMVRRSFTFTTYEGRPETSACAVVGTDVPPSESDIDQHYYDSTGYAVNLRSGRHSKVSVAEYATYVISVMREKGIRAVQDLVVALERDGAQTEDQLGAASAIAAGATAANLAPRYVSAALTLPSLTARIFTGEADFARLAELVYDDPALAARARACLTGLVRTWPESSALLLAGVLHASSKAVGTASVDHVRSLVAFLGSIDSENWSKLRSHVVSHHCQPPAEGSLHLEFLKALSIQGGGASDRALSDGWYRFGDDILQKNLVEELGSVEAGRVLASSLMADPTVREGVRSRIAASPEVFCSTVAALAKAKGAEAALAQVCAIGATRRIQWERLGLLLMSPSSSIPATVLEAVVGPLSEKLPRKGQLKTVEALADQLIAGNVASDAGVRLCVKALASLGSREHRHLTGNEAMIRYASRSNDPATRGRIALIRHMSGKENPASLAPDTLLELAKSAMERKHQTKYANVAVSCIAESFARSCAATGNRTPEQSDILRASALAMARELPVNAFRALHERMNQADAKVVDTWRRFAVVVAPPSFRTLINSWTLPFLAGVLAGLVLFLIRQTF